MNGYVARHHFAIGFWLLLLLLLTPNPALAQWWWDSDKIECGNIYHPITGGQLNIMTLNILFDMPGQLRHPTLQAIAEFAVANDIHVILGQEGVWTEIEALEEKLQTSNSAKDLKDELNAISQDPYDLRLALEAGIPGVLATTNFILTQCEISLHFWEVLPLTESVELLGFEFPITRNVQVMRVKIPDFGKIDLYNTHLCADCDVEGLRDQVETLLNIVGKTEALIPGNNPVVLGGDFNIDRFDTNEEKLLYDDIVNAGFADSYAEFQATLGFMFEDLCPGSLDQHCTEDASPIKGITNQSGFSPSRIDYLFFQGFGNVIDSQVVFNPLAPDGIGPAVSDHSAVVTQVYLAPTF